MNGIRGPVHLVGIGGKHMAAIATLLLQRGVAVTGSDRRLTEATAELERLGATVYEGHAAAQLGDPEFVVMTAALFDDNPEILEARRRGILVLSRGQMVARLMEGKRVVAVAGAHGKTTTSSMIAWILSEAGREPMYLLGDESINLGGAAAWGDSDICVVEADEFKGAFLEYDPWIAVITNVEADHLDYYKTAEAYADAFVTFARRIRPGGLLLACADDAGARSVSEAVEDEPIRVAWYGLDGERFWKASRVKLGPDGARFTVERGRAPIGELRLNIPGRHVVMNALAATAACLELDVPFEAIADALARFVGAKRRFEVWGEERGVLVMDDFAHHPTEVRTTIAAAKRRFPDSRLVIIHQPYTYSRIRYLWDDWLTCFEGADVLLVLETDAARETKGDGPQATDLAAALGARYVATHAEAARQAAGLAEAGDVIFTMGCGDVFRACPMLLEELKQ